MSDATVPARSSNPDAAIPTSSTEGGAMHAAVCERTHRKWRALLNDVVRRTGQAWVTQGDIRAAAASIDNPDAAEETLMAALGSVVSNRLRAAGPTPHAALEAITEDLAGSRTSLSSGQFMELADAVAIAHDLSPDKAIRFRTSAWNAEAHRRQEQRVSEKLARERRRDEVRR